MPKVYLYLAIAIVAEVIATSALKASDNFSKMLPSILVIGGYGVAFNYLSLVVKELPVGMTYAIWSGAGIVLVALVSMAVYRQIPDLAAWAGMGLIIAGIIVLNLFSNMGGH
ncbi:MAG: QacE family quaternary ammonium compound efflux SMR transporter [Parvularcula sp.]|nr:QacE family quaternary ammonium compound efflux SMR transporter [Parvularcula sp.]